MLWQPDHIARSNKKPGMAGFFIACGTAEWFFGV
jgi:hypothetical protein